MFPSPTAKQPVAEKDPLWEFFATQVTQVCGQQRQERVGPSPAAEQPVAEKDPLTHFGSFLQLKCQETVKLSPTAEQRPVAEKDPLTHFGSFLQLKCVASSVRRQWDHRQLRSSQLLRRTHFESFCNSSVWPAASGDSGTIAGCGAASCCKGPADPLWVFFATQVSGQQRQETVELSPTAEQQPVAEKDPF